MQEMEVGASLCEYNMSLIFRNGSEIRIAIAGLGKMGTYHLKGIQELADGRAEEYYKGNIGKILSKLRVCGLCDVLEGRVHRFPDIPSFFGFRANARKNKP